METYHKYFFSYLGITHKLEKLTETPNFLLAADAFSRSPFYYTIIKKRQYCIDLLVERLELMRVSNPKNYEKSIFAIRKDFPILIKNSSRQLHVLLSTLITSSKIISAKVPDNLPILQAGFTSNSLLSDFPNNGSEEIPVILWSSSFHYLLKMDHCKTYFC